MGLFGIHFYSVSFSNFPLKSNHTDLSLGWMTRSCITPQRSHTLLPILARVLLPWGLCYRTVRHQVAVYSFSDAIIRFLHPSPWVPRRVIPSTVAMVETRWKGAVEKTQVNNHSAVGTHKTHSEKASLAPQQRQIFSSKGMKKVTRGCQSPEGTSSQLGVYEYSACVLYYIPKIWTLQASQFF